MKIILKIKILNLTLIRRKKNEEDKLLSICYLSDVIYPNVSGTVFCACQRNLFVSQAVLYLKCASLLFSSVYNKLRKINDGFLYLFKQKNYLNT